MSFTNLDAEFNFASSTVGVGSFAFAPQKSNDLSNQNAGLLLSIVNATIMNNTAHTATACFLVSGFADLLLENVDFRNNTSPSGNLLSVSDAGEIMFNNVTMFVGDAQGAHLTPFMSILNSRQVSVVGDTLHMYSRTSNIYLRLNQWEEITTSISSLFGGNVNASAPTLATLCS